MPDTPLSSWWSNVQESLLDTARQFKERKAKPGRQQAPLSRWFTPKFPAPTPPPNIAFSIHTNRDPNICKTWNKLQDEQKQLFGTQQFYQLQKTFHFPKKILLLAFCISVTEAKVIHEAWSLPEDISMKRYCREGKKCSIEAAIECGAIYALNCGMPCSLQLHLALCSSVVNLFTVIYTLCVCTHMYNVHTVRWKRSCMKAFASKAGSIFSFVDQSG